MISIPKYCNIQLQFDDTMIQYLIHFCNGSDRWQRQIFTIVDFYAMLLVSGEYEYRALSLCDIIWTVSVSGVCSTHDCLPQVPEFDPLYNCIHNLRLIFPKLQAVGFSPMDNIVYIWLKVFNMCSFHIPNYFLGTIVVIKHETSGQWNYAYWLLIQL